MKHEKTPSEIIDKLKKDYKLSGSAQMVLLDLCYESLVSIESAREAMREEANAKRMRNGQEWSCPYGFIEDRFGNVKPHPANDIIRSAEKNIQVCMRQLGIKLVADKKEEKKGPAGTLGKLKAM